MRRKLTASALLALCAATAAGQPGGAPPKKAADPTGILIEKALAHDPDVQVARAKLALAEAELAKARQATVARAIALRDAVEQRQTELEVALNELKNVEKLRGQMVVGQAEVLPVQAKVTLAKAALARAETELKLLTGDGPKAAAAAGGFLNTVSGQLGAAPLPPDRNPEVIAELIEMLGHGLKTKAPAGTIPDRIRGALDKKVRLGNKGDGISLDAAMEVFKKEAGLDVPIRPTPSPMPRVVLDGEELPVGAWLQMFQDHSGHGGGFAFYVREYGILVANRQTAPPDAVTLTEFWRTRPAAPAPVMTKQPAGKQPAGEIYVVAHDKVVGGIKAKLGTEILITFPVKRADVDDGKLGADGVASAKMASRNDDAAVLIWGNRAGGATVSWDITTTDGRRFTNRAVAVEFE